MIKQNVPLVIVRIIAFWYQTQTMCVKWGKVNSAYFNVSNGVRQGGILTPKLFATNVDDLSHELTIQTAQYARAELMIDKTILPKDSAVKRHAYKRALCCGPILYVDHN